MINFKSTRGQQSSGNVNGTLFLCWGSGTQSPLLISTLLHLSSYLSLCYLTDLWSTRMNSNPDCTFCHRVIPIPTLLWSGSGADPVLELLSQALIIDRVMKILEGAMQIRLQDSVSSPAATWSFLQAPAVIRSWSLWSLPLHWCCGPYVIKRLKQHITPHTLSHTQRFTWCTLSKFHSLRQNGDWLVERKERKCVPHLFLCHALTRYPSDTFTSGLLFQIDCSWTFHLCHEFFCPE